MTDSKQPKPPSAAATLSAEVSRSWRDFVTQSEALRPDLYRDCRHLTHSPWAADDLVQDTLMRAFVALGCVHQEIRNPRAWLLRIASNLWLNRLRNAREVPTDQPALFARGQNVAAEGGISRLTVVDDRIAHMRTYLHQPELLAELCAELGVPYRSNGYRFWW